MKDKCLAVIKGYPAIKAFNFKVWDGASAGQVWSGLSLLGP